MFRKYICLLLVIVLFEINTKVVHGKKPYEIELDAFEPFTNTGTDFFDPGSLRIKRKGRNNFVLSGDFEIFKNLGEETLIQYEVLKKAVTGQYSTVMKGENTICKLTIGDEQYYPKIAAVSNFPYPAVCPMPKAAYSIKDFSVDEEFLPMFLAAGEYISKVSFNIAGDVVFGYKVFATIK